MGRIYSKFIQLFNSLTDVTGTPSSSTFLRGDGAWASTGGATPGIGAVLTVSGDAVGIPLYNLGPIGISPTPTVPYVFTFGTGAITYVTTTGNDGTGQRNNQTFPFATIPAAVAASDPGDAIYVGAGTFALGTSLVDLSGDNVTGISLFGAGQASTTITSTYVTPIGRAIIKPGNYSLLMDFTFNGIAAASSVQLPIGTGQNHGQTNFVGVVIYNVTINNNSDGFLTSGSGYNSFDAYNCTVNSKWDCGQFQANGTYNFHGGTFTAAASGVIDSSAQARVFSASNNNATINLFGVTALASNGTAQNWCLNTLNTGRIFAWNSTLSTTNGGTSNFDVNAAGGTIAVYQTTGSGALGAITVSPNGPMSVAPQLAGNIAGPLFVGGPIVANVASIGVVGTQKVSVGASSFIDGNLNISTAAGFGSISIGGYFFAGASGSGVSVQLSNGSFSMNDGSGSGAGGTTASMDGAPITNLAFLHSLQNSLADLDGYINNGQLAGGEWGYAYDICNTGEESGSGTGCWVQYNANAGGWCYLETENLASN